MSSPIRGWGLGLGLGLGQRRFRGAKLGEKEPSPPWYESGANEETAESQPGNSSPPATNTSENTFILHISLLSLSVVHA